MFVHVSIVNINYHYFLFFYQNADSSHLDSKRKRKHIVIFAITVAVINVVAISVVAEIVSHHKKIISYELTSSDVILLDESVSSTWCSGQTITAPSNANVEVYKTSKPIEKYNHVDAITIVRVNGSLDALASRSYRFFLLDESSVRISGCSNGSVVHLRVFRNSTMSTGCEVKSDERCPSKSVENSDLKLCPKESNIIKKIDRNSFVYVVFQNVNDMKVNMTFNITLQRVIYDLSQMAFECTVDESCTVSLSDANQLVLRVQGKTTVMNSVESIHILTECHVDIGAAFANYCYIVFPTVLASGIALYVAYLKMSTNKDILIPLLPK